MERFEAAVLPYLDDAYNLARHLVRDDHDAEDVVQEAYLRAFRFFDGFRGGDARPWLLAIVRNAAYSLRRRDRTALLTVEFSEELHGVAVAEGPSRDLDRREAEEVVQEALDQLPSRFREVLVLRELNDLSYDQIAKIVQVPVGTVMSRLSRGRKRLEALLTRTEGTER